MMGFSLFSSPVSPIAIDFGSSSVKLLQIAAGERPRLVAAAHLDIPEADRNDQTRRMDLIAARLPKLLSKGGFKGRRAIMSVPSPQTLIQHMQITPVQGASMEDLIKGQLFSQLGCPPDSIVVRHVEVGSVHRDGQVQTETICFAITRETVMRSIALLKKCRLNVVGVHTAPVAMVRAFDHINRRANDAEVTNLYVDMGWGGTTVAIAHGRDIVFARSIQLGGRHFDQHIANALGCSVETAYAHRRAMDDGAARIARPAAAAATDDEGGAILKVAAAAHATGATSATRAGGSGAGTVADDRRTGNNRPPSCHDLPSASVVTSVGNVDLTEMLDMMADELSMCLRYHRGLNPHRSIDRAILVGGEARQAWLCQHVGSALNMPAQLGDPLCRLSRDQAPTTIDVNVEEPQPGWAVPYGLCTAPTDL
jgi:type IV pilus assembly protein PilM